MIFEQIFYPLIFIGFKKLTLFQFLNPCSSYTRAASGPQESTAQIAGLQRYNLIHCGTDDYCCARMTIWSSSASSPKVSRKKWPIK
jgi:hypothetical protein